jgi:dimethylglycine dehydrogenase
MKSHTQVLVIGGGVVGCSVLYHLTKFGWKDVVLCERKELTAGSSWHAAGAFHALNSDAAMSRLQAYTVGLYPELQRSSGQDIGLHYPGGLNVASTKARWDLRRADDARHNQSSAAERRGTLPPHAGVGAQVDRQRHLAGRHRPGEHRG